MYFFKVCDIEGCEHRIIPKLYFLFQLLHAQHAPFQFHFLSIQKVICVVKSVYCPILNSHRLLWMLITVTYSVDDVKPGGEAAPLLPLPGVGGELGGQRCVLRVQPRLGGGVTQGLQRLLELTRFNTQFYMCTFCLCIKTNKYNNYKLESKQVVST